MTYSNEALNQRPRRARPNLRKGATSEIGGMISGLLPPIACNRGFFSFAEAFERHYDLIRLHPATPFAVNEREGDD
jgi:hypothetical protein